MSKYTFKISDIDYSNTSIPQNKLNKWIRIKRNRIFFDVIDYSNISEEKHIKCAIKCVQNADYKCFEKIIRNSINNCNI